MTTSPPRTAIVTGGASGIGRATCTRLLADGFRLAVADLDAAGAAGVAGPDGVARAVDVVDEAAVSGFVAEVAAAFGRIDVLVNNAGVAGTPEATVLHTTPVADWDRVLAVNVRGPFLFSRSVLPVMIDQGGGHIITIASVPDPLRNDT